MNYWRIGIAGATALLLISCSSPPREAAPPPDAELRVAPAEGATIETPAGVSAEEPLSIEYISAEPPPGPLVFAVPEASGWTHSAVPLTRQQSDIEACYDYAAAQVARDARIDYDRRQMREDSNDLLGLTTLARRVDFYSEPRRRAGLFEGCMDTKGYARP